MRELGRRSLLHGAVLGEAGDAAAAALLTSAGGQMTRVSTAATVRKLGAV